MFQNVDPCTLDGLKMRYYKNTTRHNKSHFLANLLITCNLSYTSPVRRNKTHVGKETTFTYVQQEQQSCTKASIQDFFNTTIAG